MAQSLARPVLSVIDEELLRLFSSGKTADSQMHLTHLLEEVNEAEIPLLTRSAVKSGSFPSNSLVRCRCLVQDMLDVEYYSSVFKAQSGQLIFSKYRDRIVTSSGCQSVEQMQDELEDLGIIGERIPLVCVPIPDENDWVSGVSDSSVLSVNTGASTSSVNTNINQSDEESQLKKRKTTTMNASEPESPVDNRPCCLLKIYDNMSSNNNSHIGTESFNNTENLRSVRLNDMLEVVGIYSVDDTLELLGTSRRKEDRNFEYEGTRFAGFEEFLMDEEDQPLGEDFEMESVPADVLQERNYPSKTFPRIHCLRFRILSSSFPFASHFQAEGMSLGYKQIVYSLEMALLGDRLCAEYVALMLIARSGLNAAQNSKSADMMNFGNINLNLFNVNCHENAGDIRICRLHSFLSQLLPRTTLLHINVDALNSESFFLNKHAGSRTDRSNLQVGSGTAVVFDESAMDEGVLEENGLKNIKALKVLLNSQQLLVASNYYDIHVPTDVSSIIFSKAPSILTSSATVQIPLADITPDAMDEEFSDIKNLSTMRNWWASCRNFPKPSMDEDVVAAAERDFLAVRRKHKNAEDASSSMIHRWILTAQLIAIANHAPSVSLLHWTKMQELEKSLFSRI